MMWNHHKIKRKLKRHYSRRRSYRRTVYSRDTAVLPRDIAWRGSVHNPYLRLEREQRKRRSRYAIIFSLLAVLATAGILLFHPFFQISQVHIGGTIRTSSADMSAKILAAWGKKRWLVFPANNYFLLQSDSLIKELRKAFPISTIDIRKEFPHHLTITVAEIKPALIYDDGQQYILLGSDGHMIEPGRPVITEESPVVGSEASTTPSVALIHTPPVEQLQKEMGDYPIVFDRRSAANHKANSPLTPGQVQSLLAWSDGLRRRLNIRMAFAELDDDEFGTIYTDRGIELRVRLAADRDQQLNRIAVVLKDKANKPHEYIDVRYPGRVYWQ